MHYIRKKIIFVVTYSIIAIGLITNIGSEESSLPSKIYATDHAIPEWYDRNDGSNWDMYPFMSAFDIGPVACWHFDEGNGTVAYDSSNENDGIIHGATWTSGVNETGLDFDGSNGYVEIPPIPSITNKPMDRITIEGWIYLRRESVIQQFIEAQTITHEIVIEYVPTTKSIKFDIVDDLGVLHGVSTSSLSLNTWYYIAATYDGTYQRIYLDGVIQNSSYWNGNFTITSGFKIGRDYEANIQHLNGKLDEISIYNRSLSFIEIENNFHLYSQLKSMIGITSLKRTLLPKEYFNITIYIDPIGEIGGWEIFQLNFSQELVNAIEVIPGSSWNTNFDNGTIDNDNGRITDIQAWKTGSYPSTNHTACTVHCTAIQPGVCDFVLSHVTVTDAEFEEIDVISHSTRVNIVTKPVIRNEYPSNESIGFECGVNGFRSPQNLSAYIEDLDGDSLNITLYWCPPTYCYSISGVESCPAYDYGLVEVASFVGVGNGRYEFVPTESSTVWWDDWLWGDTQYLWVVQVTDGRFWINRTYWYHTGGSRYDVTNDCLVNFIDAGKTWVNRDNSGCYGGLYDVNEDCQVNFIDAGLTWVNRD